MADPSELSDHPGTPDNRRKASSLVIIANSLDRTTFLRFLALGFFFGRLGLAFHKGITSVRIAVKIGGRCLAAQIAINALRVHVKFSGHIILKFVSYVSHVSLLFTFRNFTIPITAVARLL
jgi:hypothetical protein